MHPCEWVLRSGQTGMQTTICWDVVIEDDDENGGLRTDDSTSGPYLLSRADGIGGTETERKFCGAD